MAGLAVRRGTPQRLAGGPNTRGLGSLRGDGMKSAGGPGGRARARDRETMAGGEQRTPDEDRAVRMTVMRALEGAWRGRVGEAIAMLSGDKAVMAHAFGRTTLGTLYLESRRPREALDAFSAAAALAPESGEARCNMGVALQQLGRPGEALTAYDEAIRLQPVNVTAHFNRGVVLRLANRLDEAAAAFANAVDLSPKMVEAHVNRGLVCLMLGRHGEALASLDRALALAPGNADILQARAAALQALGQPVVQPPAPARPPPPPPPGAQAAVARGRLLIELERYADALALVSPVPRQGPVGAQALMAKAAALWKLGRVSEALGAGNAAIRLDPGNAEIHEEFSYYCLKLGDFERGWAEYEYRLERPQRRQRIVAPGVPLWRGEDLAGKRVAVLTEQGHGDTLNFVRYLRLAARARRGHHRRCPAGASRPPAFLAGAGDVDREGCGGGTSASTITFRCSACRIAWQRGAKRFPPRCPTSSPTRPRPPPGARGSARKASRWVSPGRAIQNTRATICARWRWPPWRRWRRFPACA